MESSIKKRDAVAVNDRTPTIYLYLSNPKLQHPTYFTKLGADVLWVLRPDPVQQARQHVCPECAVRWWAVQFMTCFEALPALHGCDPHTQPPIPCSCVHSRPPFHSNIASYLQRRVLRALIIAPPRPERRPVVLVLIPRHRHPALGQPSPLELAHADPVLLALAL